MKTKIPFCLSLFFILCGFSLFGQIITTTPNSSFSSCDGTATYSGPPITNIIWLGYVPHNTSLPSGNTTITNLCSGCYYVHVDYPSGESDTLWFDMNPSGMNCDDLVINLDYLSLNTSPDFCDGSGSVFTSGGSGNYSYFWNTFPGSNTISDNLCPGQVCVGVQDANGCFTDTIFSLHNTTAYVSELSSQAVNIYPNPVSDQLHLELKNTEAVQIRIYDVKGKLCLEQQFSELNNLIDLQKLESGMYEIELFRSGLGEHFKMHKL